MDLVKDIKTHYQKYWGQFSEYKFDKGPIDELPHNFSILKFAPTSKRNMWTYATSGMSNGYYEDLIEIHMFSIMEYDFLIELLTTIVHYHHTCSKLGLGHTINFGCPWFDNSNCEYGLISLPYLDGPLFEWLNSYSYAVRFLWLIPITKDEVQYKKRFGIESLEELFEKSSFNYLDYTRDSVLRA